MAGFWPPNSNKTGVRCSAAALITAFPAATLPVRKMKSNGSCNSSLTFSRLPVTADSASGSRYFGINSRSKLPVAGSASESFKIQGFPAESAAAAGRSDKKKGPIEWAYDQRNAIRFAVNNALMPGCSQEFWERSFDGFHPLLELGLGKFDGCDGCGDLEDVFLQRGLEINP